MGDGNVWLVQLDQVTNEDRELLRGHCISVSVQVSLLMDANELADACRSLGLPWLPPCQEYYNWIQFQSHEQEHHLAELGCSEEIARCS